MTDTNLTVSEYVTDVRHDTVDDIRRMLHENLPADWEHITATLDRAANIQEIEVTVTHSDGDLGHEYTNQENAIESFVDGLTDVVDEYGEVTDVTIEVGRQPVEMEWSLR